MSRSYEVPLTELIPAVKDQVAPDDTSSSDEDDDDQPQQPLVDPVIEPAVGTNEGTNANTVAAPTTESAAQPRCSTRVRREPAWLRGNEWER